MVPAVPIHAAQHKLGQWAGRHWALIDVAIASVVGVALLPPIFQSMRTRDIQLADRVSLVFALWFGLAIIATVVILRARADVVRDADSATSRLLDLTRAGGQARAATSTTSDASPEALRQRGVIVVHELIDLILLFVLQATVRQPFVGLAGPRLPPGTVDGAFVVVVVLVAIAVLIRLRGASRPLIERLAFAGLDQVVPTAGFSSGSTAATFAARRSTSTSRSVSSPSGRAAAPKAEAVRAGAPSDVTRPTLQDNPAAAIAAELAATQLAGTELAPTPAASMEATVLAPRVEAAPGRSPHQGGPDETVVAATSDETVVAPPSSVIHPKDGAS